MAASFRTPMLVVCATLVACLALFMLTDMQLAVLNRTLQGGSGGAVANSPREESAMLRAAAAQEKESGNCLCGQGGEEEEEEEEQHQLIVLPPPWHYFDSNHWFHISEYYIARHRQIEGRLAPHASIYIVTWDEGFVAHITEVCFFFLLMTFTDGLPARVEIFPATRLYHQHADVYGFRSDRETYVYDPSLPLLQRFYRHKDPGTCRCAHYVDTVGAAPIERGHWFKGDDDAARMQAKVYDLCQDGTGLLSYRHRPPRIADNGTRLHHRYPQPHRHPYRPQGMGSAKQQQRGSRERPGIYANREAIEFHPRSLPTGDATPDIPADLHEEQRKELIRLQTGEPPPPSVAALAPVAGQLTTRGQVLDLAPHEDTLSRFAETVHFYSIAGRRFHLTPVPAEEDVARAKKLAKKASARYPRLRIDNAEAHAPLRPKAADDDGVLDPVQPYAPTSPLGSNVADPEDKGMRRIALLPVRHKLVVYQRDTTRRFLYFDEVLELLRVKLGPSWDIQVIKHHEHYPACLLYMALHDADMFLTTHGFQSMAVLFMKPSSVLYEVFPYKYWKVGYQPLAEELHVHHAWCQSEEPASFDRKVFLPFIPQETCMQSVNCRGYSRGDDVILSQANLEHILETAHKLVEQDTAPSASTASSSLSSLSLLGREHYQSGQRPIQRRVRRRAQADTDTATDTRR